MTHDELLAAALKAHGIVYPVSTIYASRKNNLALSVCCTNIDMETSGGINEFGHDPTSSIPVSWRGSRVTKLKYLYYKARRGRYGLQGVGPCQLTSAGLQDKADKLGGCWLPQPNMVVGFEFLHGLINQYGSVRLGFQHYNGTGPAAVNYGYKAEALVKWWEKVIQSVPK